MVKKYFYIIKNLYVLNYLKWREGILKHCARANAEWLEAREPGGVGARFLRGESPSLEAQLVNVADEIAYNAHDIDDGVRSGLLTLEQLEQVELFDAFRREALAQHPHLRGRRLLYEAIRRMLSAQVYDVIAATRTALSAAGVRSPWPTCARSRRCWAFRRRCARRRRGSSASCSSTCTATRR